jgi:hypothetical protein
VWHELVEENHVKDFDEKACRKETIRKTKTCVGVRIHFYLFIIIINFKLRVGFHPVAVALKRHTNKT